MENYLNIALPPQQVTAISNLGLAHIGDGVYELLCRTYLCCRGGKNVGKLHADTVALVNAASQAAMADALLPELTEEELAFYRRGKNAHVHAVPRGCTPAQYAKATGLEALFGALWLLGRRERVSELFYLGLSQRGAPQTDRL